MPGRNAISGGDFTALKHSTSYDYISPLKLNLTGKHVLVTGAAWDDGVGYATATAFVRAGASAIAIADLNEISPELIERLRSAAVGLTKPEEVFAVREILSQSFKRRLDIVVNNAAHMEPYQPFLESDPEVYWRTYEVNLRGLFNMAREFLPMQLSTYSGVGAGGSCIMINVASSGALTARPGSSNYRSSKLAILRWTESLQLEYADQGLVAISVNPGSIKTQITSGVPEKARVGLSDHPSVAGDTIVWLASERREWLGGRYVSCPWDMEELVRKKDEIVGQDKLAMRMTF